MNPVHEENKRERWMKLLSKLLVWREVLIIIGLDEDK
jgi:hypothetical protein